MVTKVYLIRHAEAEGNINETFQGRTDTHVTEKGQRQLERLAERFRTIPLTAVYASPLLRTQATAAAVNRYHQLPVQYQDALMEIDGGVWEGEHWSRIPMLYPKAYALWQTEMHNFTVERGESMEMVYNRMRDAVNAIATENPGGTVAVVSHGCAIRNFLSYVCGGIMTLGEMGWSDNTSVSLVEYGDALPPKLVFRNDASHLPPALSTLAGSKWCRTEADTYVTDTDYMPGEAENGGRTA